MTRIRYLDDDDDDILRDGEVLRVPLRMMDGWQHDMSKHFDQLRRDGASLHDGLGGEVGHRPGFAMTNDAAIRDARAQARTKYIKEVRDAWQPPPTSALPDHQQDRSPMNDAREEAYQAYKTAISGAWRSGR
jgi:hypothetical protein